MSLSNKKILIVTDSLATKSETFIRNHIKYLPGTKFVLHNLWLPRIDDSRAHPRIYVDLPYRLYRHWCGKVPTSSRYNKHILNEIRCVKPDVILLQYGTIAGRMIDALEQSRIPHVVYFRGYDATRISVLKNYADAYKRLASSASAVVAVSRSLQDSLFKLGFPKEKVHYCPSGIETSKFEMAAAPDLADPIFLATGRFVGKKAPYLTLLAFAKVRSEFPETKLVMIGDGPLQKFCHELAFNVLKLGDSVQMLGSADHSVVCKHLYKARGFVQHSIQAPDGNRRNSEQHHGSNDGRLTCSGHTSCGNSRYY